MKKILLLVMVFAIFMGFMYSLDLKVKNPEAKYLQVKKRLPIARLMPDFQIMDLFLSDTYIVVAIVKNNGGIYTGDLEFLVQDKNRVIETFSKRVDFQKGSEMEVETNYALSTLSPNVWGDINMIVDINTKVNEIKEDNNTFRKQLPVPFLISSMRASVNPTSWTGKSQREAPKFVLKCRITKNNSKDRSPVRVQFRWREGDDWMGPGAHIFFTQSQKYYDVTTNIDSMGVLSPGTNRKGPYVLRIISPGQTVRDSNKVYFTVTIREP